MLSFKRHLTTTVALEEFGKLLVIAQIEGGTGRPDRRSLSVQLLAILIPPNPL